MTRQRLSKIALILLSLVFLGILAGCSGASTNTQGATPVVSPTPNVSGSVNGPFTATILQGAKHGTSLKGTLNLHVASDGVLSGTLTNVLEESVPLAQSVPVVGQMKGQLIGLSFALGSGQTISGTGVIGYDPTTKKNSIGGTFAGPDETSSGVWTYLPTTSAGGCTLGLLVYDSRPGLGYVCKVYD